MFSFKQLFILSISTGLVAALASVASCNETAAAPRTDSTATAQTSAPTEEELITRGKYLVTIGSCNDCHSPKIMTPQGPVPDSTRLLSGHPANETLPPDVNTPGWVKFNPGLTACSGPWGISFAANLTPDQTGIGNWDFARFKKAIREGKSKGLDAARPLLPPMPWPMISKMTDEDLEAVFTYLQSIKPVANIVPAPIPPAPAK